MALHYLSFVIPAEAEATLDVRAVPDENIDALIAEDQATRLAEAE